MASRRVVWVVLGLSVAACSPRSAVPAGNRGGSSSGSGSSSGTGSSSGDGSSSGSGSSTSGSSSSGGGSSTSGGSSSGGGSSTSGGASSGGSSSGGACPSSEGGGVRLSIDAGGPAVDAFRADGFYSGGSTYSTTSAIDTSAVPCDAPPASVFQTERYGEFTYTLPNRAAGTPQTVTLYFAESLLTAAGKRTFDVAINDTKVLTAFDIFAEAGGANRAIARTFATTADANGKVTIAFTRTGPDNPKVCALTISGAGAPAPQITAPCDLYEGGGTPCIAAHSTIRALYGAYSGNLYQVRRPSDGSTKDIPVLAPGGYADASVQDAFCAGTTCVITVLYDQSGMGNHLEYQGPGSTCGGKDDPAVADTESLTAGGQKVYSLFIKPGNSYWRNGSRSGVPTGAAPEGMYMVTSGTHVNGGCCFDYGNSETTRKADGAGAMDAIYFGTSCWFGGCSGSGPWVQADLEWGLYPGGSQQWNPAQQAFRSRYVTAMLKNDGTARFALKGGDAGSGSLTTLWDGALPSGYSPMKKQGAIVLGSGGDCCADGRNQSEGTFYEGAIVSGYPSDETDASVQANVVAAGYGR